MGLDDLNARFRYKLDRPWRILKGDGPLVGDCEDYALTLAWMLSGRSMVRFWIDMILLRHVIWIGRTPSGETHAVLWSRGQGWIDNIQRKWVTRSDLHWKGYRLWFPAPAPLVALMLLMGRL